MNESINPYESPQAEDAILPSRATGPLSLPGMRTTGIGLSLIYYGIVIILLAFLVNFFHTVFFFLAPGNPAGPIALPASFGIVMTISSIAILVAVLMMFSGNILCLFIPWQSGAKGLIIAAVTFQMLSIVPSVLLSLNLLTKVTPAAVHRPFLFIYIFQGASVICFILFMRKASAFIGRRDLINRSRNLLLVLLVVACIAIVRFVGLSQQRDEFAGLLGFALWMGALCCFIMYANLINALRKVLLGKATGSSENEDPNSGRLIAAGKRLA